MVDDKLKESEGEQLLKKFTEGKYNELVDEIEKLLKEYEDSPFAYSLLGNALFNLKNFKDSIKAFEKEIKVSEEEHFLPYYNLGRNYEMLNNSELEFSISQFVMYCPTHPLAPVIRIISFFKMKLL